MYMKITEKLFILLIFFVMISGCKAVYKTERVAQSRLAGEPQVGFVRPDKYTILGTRSVCDYIEIVYEKKTTNEAGFPLVELGVRNRGGQHFWDLKGPPIVLSVKATFYNAPIQSAGPTGAPVYETNWQTVRIVRGDTAHYRVVCPVKEARHYQLMLSELIK